MVFRIHWHYRDSLAGSDTYVEQDEWCEISAALAQRCPRSILSMWVAVEARLRYRLHEAVLYILKRPLSIEDGLARSSMFWMTCRILNSAVLNGRQSQERPPSTEGKKKKKKTCHAPYPGYPRMIGADHDNTKVANARGSQLCIFLGRRACVYAVVLPVLLHWQDKTARWPSPILVPVASLPKLTDPY